MLPNDASKQDVDAQLMEWNMQINHLAVEIEQVRMDLKLKYAREINEIRAKQREAARKSKDLERASESSKLTADKIWRDLRTRMSLSISRIW